MGSWDKVPLAVTAMGFQMMLLALVNSDDGHYTSLDDAVEACLIIAFLSYMAALFVLVLNSFGDTPLKGKKESVIVGAVVLFLAALFILCGLAVRADRMFPNETAAPYSTTVFSIAMLFAIFAGVICVLDVVKGASGSVDNKA